MPLTSQNDADNNALAANTQVLGDEQASAAFSELEPSRQILVFRSLQEALEADPPRPQASFANCVAAYEAVEDVSKPAKPGSWITTSWRCCSSACAAPVAALPPG